MNIIAKLAVTLLLVANMFLGHSTAVGQKSDAAETMMGVSYSVSNLPVWSLDDAKKPVFDASLLISRIKNEIQPELWKSGRARLFQSAEDASLILFAPKGEYSKLNRSISSLLGAAYSFSEHDAKIRLKGNLELAELGGEQVLLFCTHADSIFYENFSTAKHENSELNKLLTENYIVQCVPSTKAKKLSLTAPSRLGAGFTILSADGKTVATKNFDSWQDSTADLLTEFAERNVKKFADAKVLLDNGLLKARKQGKKVLVQVGGPSCGPCIMLTRYLRKHKQLMNKDYVHVKLDERMANAEFVKESYGSGFETIPWMVVLSFDGELLASGLSPNGNIAFPRAGYQQEHFKKMLVSTCEKLSAEDISTLMDDLPEAFDSPSK